MQAVTNTPQAGDKKSHADLWHHNPARSPIYCLAVMVKTHHMALSDCTHIVKHSLYWQDCK